MPYKNPEDKRRWEREHHAQRNAQRRAQRSGSMTRPLVLSPEPDPVSGQEPRNGWKLVIALVVGFGCALVGMLSGVHFDKAR